MEKSSWFYSVIVLFTVRCVAWLTKESISCVCVVNKLLVCWKRRRQFSKKHSFPFLNCFLLTNMDAAVLFEGKHLSLFMFVCGISVTEQLLLLGHSCCWKKLCDETLSQPSSPSNTVANIVKINKQKTPNKQIDRDLLLPTASHQFYLLFLQNSSTEIFQDLSHTSSGTDCNAEVSVWLPWADTLREQILGENPRNIFGSPIL